LQALVPFQTSQRAYPGHSSGSGAAFSSFLERDALREKRRKSRRNTLVLSLLVHGLAVAAVVGYSMWDVEELWGPSVKVKVYKASAVPRAALVGPPAPSAPSQ
jgi:hypothetical protein